MMKIQSSRRRIGNEIRFWLGIVALLLAWPFVLIDAVGAYFDKDE